MLGDGIAEFEGASSIKLCARKRASIPQPACSVTIGRKFMAERNRMFKWWHRVRDGTLERREFQRRMRMVEPKVGQLRRCGLTAGACLRHRFCRLRRGSGCCRCLRR